MPEPFIATCWRVMVACLVLPKWTLNFELAANFGWNDSCGPPLTTEAILGCDHLPGPPLSPIPPPPRAPRLSLASTLHFCLFSYLFSHSFPSPWLDTRQLLTTNAAFEIQPPPPSSSLKRQISILVALTPSGSVTGSVVIFFCFLAGKGHACILGSLKPSQRQLPDAATNIVPLNRPRLFPDTLDRYPAADNMPLCGGSKNVQRKLVLLYVPIHGSSRPLSGDDGWLRQPDYS